MTTCKKITLTAAAMVLSAGLAVGGTLAYLNAVTETKGESCDIKLVLYIDGRSMDNSYMNKQGQLEITVNAEQPDLQDTVSNNVITAVKTGDSNNILLYIIVALAGIAGIAGVVVMRQRNRQ